MSQRLLDVNDFNYLLVSLFLVDLLYNFRSVIPWPQGQRNESVNDYKVACFAILQILQTPCQSLTVIFSTNLLKLAHFLRPSFGLVAGRAYAAKRPARPKLFNNLGMHGCPESSRSLTISSIGSMTL